MRSASASAARKMPSPPMIITSSTPRFVGQLPAKVDGLLDRGGNVHAGHGEVAPRVTTMLSRPSSGLPIDS